MAISLIMHVHSYCRGFSCVYHSEAQPPNYRMYLGTRFGFATSSGSLGSLISCNAILPLVLTPVTQLPLLSVNLRPSPRSLASGDRAVFHSGGVSRPQLCCGRLRCHRFGTNVRYIVSRNCLVVPKVNKANGLAKALGIRSARFVTA